MSLGRRLRPLAIALPLVGAIALVAAPALAAEVSVSIVGKAFEPAERTVAVGDTVTWTVTQGINEPHSVKSGKSADADAGSLFDSGIDNLKDNGQTFQFAFTTPGTVDYFCVVHPEMVGKIIVTAAGGEGEGHGEPVSNERKLIAGGILVVTLIVGFAAAFVWRRMNPA